MHPKMPKAGRFRQLTENEAIISFWCRVDKTNDCWLWSGTLTDTGYGHMWYLGKRERCHRISYKLSFGEIPKGLLVCHHCDVRNCVNPSHLFLGTKKDNAHDMVVKGRHASQIKTHCINGHEFTVENTYNYPSGRVCVTCSKRRNIESQKRKAIEKFEPSRNN